jgi:hypothetical protein
VNSLAKATATSAGITAGTWIATEAVFGFWGLVLAVPVTLGTAVWFAARTRKADE